MQHRTFGKTQLPLSIISLGMRQLQYDPEDPDRDRKKDVALQTIRRALELGVNHIETSAGIGTGEELVGLALQSVPRESVHVTIKIRPGISCEEMARQIEESLRRMRLEYVDHLVLHGLNTAEHLNEVTSEKGCMKAVEEAREKGLVRHVGFATQGQLDFIYKAIHSELFESVGLHYGYFHQRNLPLLERAAEMEMGVFVLSPAYCGGKLQKPPRLLLETCDPFHPAALNDRFILQQKAVTTLVVGPASVKELHLHQPVFDNDGPLSDEENLALARMDVRRIKLPDSWCTFCHDCLPCPEDILIPEILRLRNMTLAYDMTDFARERYRFFENGGHWFPGRQGDRCTDCGDCIPRCPERLDIPKLLREAHKKLAGKAKLVRMADREPE